MIQASPGPWSHGRQQATREEMCPGNAAWSWSPTSGPLHTRCHFQMPTELAPGCTPASVPMSPRWREATCLRGHPQLPTAPLSLFPRRSTPAPMLPCLFLVACSCRASVSPRSGALQGRFLLPGTSRRCTSCSLGLSCHGRPFLGVPLGEKGRGT